MWLFLALALFAPAAAPAAAPPETVAIYGNRIYDDETIFREAGLGYDSSSFSLAEIRKRLVGTGFFSRVRVSRSGDRLDISVVEKIPAFVLPYFAASSQRKVFGLAAGLVGADEGASQILARYQIGNGAHAGSLYYRKDFVFDSFALVLGSLDYESALHDVYSGRDVVRSFSNWQVNTTLGAGTHLTPDLVLELDTHVELHKFEDTDGREKKGTQVSHRAFAEIGSLFEDEGLVSGWKLKPYVELTNPASTFTFQQWGALAETNVLRRGVVNWVARPRIEQGQGLPRYQLFELGGPRLRGYSFQTFRSDHYASVQNDVTVAAWPLLNAKVMLRPFFFGDFAYVENGGRPGLGAGLNFYFRHVSVPAIQLAAGFGLHPAGFSVAAAIGPSL